MGGVIKETEFDHFHEVTSLTLSVNHQLTAGYSVDH